MTQKIKRPLSMLLVIAIALSVGIGVSFLWDFLDRLSYPQSYHEAVSRYSTEYDIPEYVIYAVIKVESNFRPRAKSPVGAVGLMQMLPNTFEWLTGDEHLGEHLDPIKMEEPEISIKYGAYYLRYLYDKFQNWDTTFAAYNWGEGNVAKLLEDDKYSDGNGGLTYIPVAETRNYVPKVNQAIEFYKKLYYTE